MHERLFVNLNLKMSNLYLDSENQLKIVDLGVESLMRLDKVSPAQVSNIPLEILGTDSSIELIITDKTMIWSLGVILY